MNESLIAFRQLLIPDQKLTESVEPGMSSFNDPTSVLRGTPACTLLSCDPWGIAPGADLFSSWLAVVSLIRIQESLPSFGKGNDNGIEHGGELTDIMSMGPGHDQRQRDATSVHQKVALASLFSPYLSGSARRLPVPAVL